MKRMNGFIKKVSTYFVGTLSTKMLSVLLVPLYAYYVSGSDLGEYDTIASLAHTIAPMVFACIWEAILKYCIKRDGREAEYISNAIFFTIGMTVISLISIPIITVFFGFSKTILIAILIDRKSVV